ncbi:MAG: hypothetical protein ACRCWW_00970 [Scandinavium sp.]|uniref:hypothetical protein n=1 Tax=Scandinavium sp. TaxID=2830653 RepID=UPI003F37B471
MRSLADGRMPMEVDENPRPMAVLLLAVLAVVIMVGYRGFCHKNPPTEAGLVRMDIGAGRGPAAAVEVRAASGEPLMLAGTAGEIINRSDSALF